MSEEVDVKVLIHAITNKDNIYLLSDFQKALLLAIDLSNNMDCVQVVDENKRINYNKIIEDEDIPAINVLVHNGKLTNLHEHSVLLLNGNVFEKEQLEEVNNMCLTNNIVLINDITECYNKPTSKIGEFIIGQVKDNAFLACNEILDVEEDIIDEKKMSFNLMRDVQPNINQN